MRIVFGSDLHGSATAGQKLVEAVEREDAQCLVLCGDIYYHGPRNPLPLGHGPMELAEILNRKKDIIRCVKGNCDSEVDAMISQFKFEEFLALEAFGKKIFVSHGHVYDKNNLPPFPFDIMVYGHYHISSLEKINGKFFASPGSPSLPKGGSQPAYILLAEKTISLKDLDGNRITARRLSELE